MAYRDRESLKWCTNLMAMSNDVTLFCYEDEGGVRGYLIFLKEIAENTSLTRGNVSPVQYGIRQIPELRSSRVCWGARKTTYTARERKGRPIFGDGPSSQVEHEP
jgi:hypothetical protein